MKKLIFLIVLSFPLIASAQRPKMYLKLFAGSNASTLVYREDSVNSDYLIGWNVGGGFRVHHRKAMGEIDFIFRDQGISYSSEDSDLLPEGESLDVILRGFEVPITAGYTPVKTPLLAWSLYGGVVNAFNLKGKVKFLGEEIELKPKEIKLHTYNLGAKFGTQVDVAMINIDFSYTIGVTNSFKDNTRTNSHSFSLTLGILF
jgi:hypothetical protein